MNNRQRHWLPILLLTALLTSCAGGTSGSVLGSRESCFINAGSGSCEGTLIGVASGEFDGFEVVFEALDGEATGITYQITYQVR